MKDTFCYLFPCRVSPLSPSSTRNDAQCIAGAISKKKEGGVFNDSCFPGRTAISVSRARSKLNNIKPGLWAQTFLLWIPFRGLVLVSQLFLELGNDPRFLAWMQESLGPYELWFPFTNAQTQVSNLRKGGETLLAHR